MNALNWIWKLMYSFSLFLQIGKTASFIMIVLWARLPFQCPSLFFLSIYLTTFSLQGHSSKQTITRRWKQREEGAIKIQRLQRVTGKTSGRGGNHNCTGQRWVNIKDHWIRSALTSWDETRGQNKRSRKRIQNGGRALKVTCGSPLVLPSSESDCWSGSFSSPWKWKKIYFFSKMIKEEHL